MYYIFKSLRRDDEEPTDAHTELTFLLYKTYWHNA